MEENNFNNENVNNEAVIENIAVEEAPIEAPVAEEPVVETKVEEVAAENNIQASVSEVSESSDAITTNDLSRSASDTVQAVGSIVNGVIGVTQTPRSVKQPAAPSAKKSDRTVAIHSTKNVSWSGVGKVYRGYNIVTPEQSEKWLTRNHIRLATPEEVAKEFGR
jgi:hypothetical protein